MTTPSGPGRTFHPRLRALYRAAITTGAAIAIPTVLIAALRGETSGWRDAVGFGLAFGVGVGTIVFLARLVFEGRRAVTVFPSGIRARDADGQLGFCGWDTITDVAILTTTGSDTVVSVSGRYLPRPLHINLDLAKHSGFVQLVQGYAGAGNLLSTLLRERAAAA